MYFCLNVSQLNLGTTKIMILLLAAIATGGCSSVKKLPDNTQLVIKEDFALNGTVLKRDPVALLSVNPPNTRLFGIPLKLNIYNLSQSNTDSLFDNWLDKKQGRREKWNRFLSAKQVDKVKTYKRNFNDWLKENGEPPALLSKETIAQTENRLEQYHKNKGYFNTTVSSKIDTLGPKKAAVHYSISTGEVFLMDSISSVIASQDIQKIYQAEKSQSFLKSNTPFENNLFEQERERLINSFKNNGIFNFQQRSIRFKAFKDSLGQDLYIPVIVEIKNAQERIGDSLIEKPYKIKHINEVELYINPAKSNFTIFTDSVTHQGIKLYSVGKLKYKPEVLTRGILIKQGAVYSNENRTKTYRYFSDLQNFKFPSIGYTEDPKDSLGLIAKVNLTPRERFSLGFDFDVQHSNIQDIGINLGSSLLTRNIFRGAEILEFGINSNVGSSRDVAVQKSSFFNLFEIGGDLRLRVPSLLIFSRYKNLIPVAQRPQTTISIGTSFQENIGLDRQNFTASFEYNWNPKPIYTANFKLIDLEFINNKAIFNYFNVYRNSYDRLNAISREYPLEEDVYTSAGNLSIPTGATTFIDRVLSQRTPLQPQDEDFRAVAVINERKNRLTINNFILGSSFSFTKNNQTNLLDEDFSQVRFKVEWAGNLLNSLLKLSGQEKNENGAYGFLGLEPSQFIKTEISYIKHWRVGRERVMAFRSFVGVALPYGNANNIPFTRSYFAGGSNDNRAWKAYKLGPGRSVLLNEFNEANFKIALNLEYRFPVFGNFKGALFMDAGNIWNVLDNVEDPAQRFDGIQDLEELALGTGIGVRYDFDYFVLRLDTAFKTYDPSKSIPQRWWSQVALDRAVFNIGINYPF